MLGDYLIAYERGQVVATGEPGEIFGGPVTGSIARLTGVENVFDGLVLHRNAGAGTMRVRISDQGGVCELDVPVGKEEEGERVMVAVRSGDILLATEELRNTSARNILRGHIKAIEERGARSIVRVESGVTWDTSVTWQAVSALGLVQGQEIWLAIKTNSCYLIAS